MLIFVAVCEWDWSMLSLVVVHYSDLVLVQWAHNIEYHSTHSVKLAPSVRLSLGHFQCKCSHSPYTFSAKHLKCFAG